MAKIIKTGTQTVIMEISKTELNVYVNSFLNQLNDEPIEERNDQSLVLMAIAGLEPLIPHCSKEIQNYYQESLTEISAIEWEDAGESAEESNDESVSNVFVPQDNFDNEEDET